MFHYYESSLNIQAYSAIRNAGKYVVKN